MTALPLLRCNRLAIPQEYIAFQDILKQDHELETIEQCCLVFRDLDLGVLAVRSADRPQHLLSQRRLQIMGVEQDDATGAETAIVEDFYDIRQTSPLSFLQNRREWLKLGNMVNQVRRLQQLLRRRALLTPAWQRRLDALPPCPPEAETEDLSFWLYALAAADVDEELAIELFYCTCAPRRLRLVLEVLHRHPPQRANRRDKRPMSTLQALNLERAGGFAPLPADQKRLTLADLCLEFMIDNIDLVYHDLPHMPESLLQELLTLLNDRNLMDLPTLVALQNCQQLKVLRLSGADVDAQWIDSIQAAHYSLTELQFLSCFKVENTNDNLVRAILAHPNLQTLSFERSRRIDQSTLTAVLPHLPNLRHVSVSGTHVEESGLLAIGQHCSALRELDVSSLLSFKDAVAEAVLGPEAANGGKLTTFIATASRMTSVGAAYLGRHTNLQILSMQLNTGVQDWTFLASLHQITDLDLSLNALVDDAAFLLIADNMPQLQHLWLTKTSVTDEAAPALAKLTGLRVLGLGRNDVGDGIASALSCLPELRSLALDYSNVTAYLAEQLSSLQHMRTLKLTGCLQFGDAGVALLASAVPLSHTLEALHIGGPGITNAAVHSLQQLTALESLQLWESAVNSVGARQLIRPQELAIDDQIRCAEGTWIFIHPRRLAGP